MKRIFALGALSATIAALFAATTSAQQPGPLPFSDVQQSPTTSPYLNLFNNNTPSNPVYQNIVKPQITARETAVQQQNQLQQLQKQVNSGRPTNGPTSLDPNKIRPTGFAPQFQNLSHYYTASPAFRTRQ